MGDKGKKDKDKSKKQSVTKHDQEAKRKADKQEVNKPLKPTK